MKFIILLYSDFDNQIILTFICAVGILLALNWVWKNSKSIKSREVFSSFPNKNKLEFDNYTLSFNTEINKANKLSVLSKLVLVSLSIIILTTPLYEFIETLRPAVYVYRWTCFGF